MEDQNAEVRSESSAEGDTVTKVERRRSGESESEAGAVRVKLPGSVGIRVKGLVAELKSRGAQVTAEELVGEYLEAIPERYFELQLQKRTPEPYYLEAATKIPELREMLIRQAKRGLIRTAVPLGDPKVSRRSRRKREDRDADASPAVASVETK